MSDYRFEDDLEPIGGAVAECAGLVADYCHMYYNYRGYTVDILKAELLGIRGIGESDVEAILQSPAVSP